jgi:hypothetical protein
MNGMNTLQTKLWDKPPQLNLLPVGEKEGMGGLGIQISSGVFQRFMLSNWDIYSMNNKKIYREPIVIIRSNCGEFNRRQCSGQVAPFAIISILMLAMLWMMLVNVSKLVKDRIVMQNAADCAAQSAACIRARGLNQVGFLNSILGGIIIVKPYMGWIPYLNCYTTYAIASKVSKAQTGIVKSYGGGLAYQAALEVARAQGSDMISANPGTFSLGIEHRFDVVTFWSTAIIDGVPVPAPPTIKEGLYTCYFLKHANSPEKSVIFAHKSPSPQFFGKGLFGIRQIPSIVTVAAARPYNTKGPMFPKEDTEWGCVAVIAYAKAIKGWEAQLVPVGGALLH